mmetsp:Transcript_28927/g.86068  ORF Transcript_28927/g.86068 Transcript_28927/m.86068 type:complete len:983 (-) Transcript_28927:26-2974(-)
MQFSPESTQRLETALQWPDMQAPVHVTPHSAHNSETFASTVASPCDLSMADISQQTLAMNAQLRQAAQDVGDNEGAGVDRLLEPRRIGSMLSQPAEVEMPTQSVLGTDAWPHLASQPMHLQQPMQPQVVQPMTEGGTSEMERQLHMEQQQQHQRIAQTAQILQHMASQSTSAGASLDDFLQRMVAEISKQCSGEAMACWGDSAGAVSQGLPVWGCPWPQQVQSSSAVGGQDSFGSDQRVEELNHYIRQQAQEYIEGQAEWSRQIAEVRSECLRELEKVKREKGEVERQARQELLRLQQRLRDAGLKDEAAASGDGAYCGAESSVRPVAAWAAGVSLEEFQHVQRKCTAADGRIQELEQYIKDQSAKQLLCADGQIKEKDEEIQKLRQVIVSNSMELRQATSELQALRVHHHHKVLFWEHGARRLLGTVERFLNQSQRGSERGGEGEELENGRFGRTATKLSLTLSEGEGGDVGSLRRLLKDVLKNGKDKGAKRSPQKAKEGRAEDQPAGETGADELQKSDEDGKLEDKSAEGECSTPWMPAHPGCAPSMSLSDSIPSSRDTSPGRGSFQIVERSGVAHGGGAVAAAQSARVSSLMSQFANDLRQLLAMSQQAGPGSPPCLTPVDASPRSGSVAPPSSPAPTPAEGGHGAAPHDEGGSQLRQLLDSLGPVRRGLTQNIIAVEKMLRGLDRDLRGQCEELLGGAEPAVLRHSDFQGIKLAAAEDVEEEAQRCLPLGEEGQLLSLVGLRNAQQQSSAALAEFIQLPQKLKVVFDLTKRLANEVGGLVPCSVLRQAGVQASAARSSEQRHPCHVELLQRQPQAPAAASGPEAPPLTPLQEVSEEGDDDLVRQEIREELERGISCEDQLMAARVRLRCMTRSLDSREERLRTLERELVDLHLSRYNERAQCMSFLQQQQQQQTQSSGLQGAKPPWWPWVAPGSAPDFGDPQAAALPPWTAMCQQAWGPGGHGLLPGVAEWPPATCVA